MSFICHIHNYTEYNEEWNVFSAFNPSKCTHLEQWAADCAASGEQSWTFCRSRDSNPQPWVTSGFKSNALSTRPTTARDPWHILLHRYRYILLCFYYFATVMYSGGSEFKYPGSVPKNLCSIVLEKCATPNPTLNLPDSVRKCKTDIQTCLLMQPCHFNFLIYRFELLCRTVITRSWKC